MVARRVGRRPAWGAAAPREASPGGGGGPTADPAIEWSRCCRWGMEAGGECLLGYSRVRVAVEEGEESDSEAAPRVKGEGLPQPLGLGRSWGDFRNMFVNY